MAQWHPYIKLFHWLMAVLLIAMLGLGFGMTRLAQMAQQSGDFTLTLLSLSIFDAYQLHKSIGVVLFVMVLLRLLLRSRIKPDIHHDLPPLEHCIARFVHFVLYGLMFTLPLSGWFLASASTLGIPTIVFGLFPLPHVIAPSASSETFWSWAHFSGGLALLALVAMHVAAAFKHHYWNHDEVLLSMLPRGLSVEERKRL